MQFISEVVVFVGWELWKTAGPGDGVFPLCLTQSAEKNSLPPCEDQTNSKFIG